MNWMRLFCFLNRRLRCRLFLISWIKHFSVAACLSVLLSISVSAAQIELTGLTGIRNSPNSRQRSRPNQSDENDIWCGLKFQYADSLRLVNNDTASLYWDVIAFKEDENVYSSSEPLLNILELFITTDIGDYCAINIGRLNLVNGISSSYRPVDYFRYSTIVMQDSFSLRDLIRNRIGQIGFQFELFHEKLSTEIFLSPKIESISENSNSKDCVLLKMVPELGANLYSEFYLFLDDDSHNIGGSLSYNLLPDLLGYLEFNVSDDSDTQIIDNSDNDTKFTAIGNDHTLHLVIGSSLQVGRWFLSRLEYVYLSDGYNSEQSDDYYNIFATSDKTNSDYINALNNYSNEFSSQHYMYFETEYYINKLKMRIIPTLIFNLQDQSYSLGLNFNWEILDNIQFFSRSYFRMGDERSEFGSAPDKTVIFSGIKYCF